MTGGKFPRIGVGVGPLRSMDSDAPENRARMSTATRPFVLRSPTPAQPLFRVPNRACFSRANPTKAKRISTKLGRLFPKIDSRAQYAWTGSFGSSPNGMPTIGAIPGFPRCYAVMGFGGNGITFSMLAAKLIAAAVLGKKDSESSLFAFK
jgi:glycine/D-amino acid oxidase-like deaminating enzyme